jgi:protein-disulfide isomerase
MKNTIEVSMSAVVFVVVLMMGMVGVSGYFYGKSSTPVVQGVTTEQQAAAPQQPAPPAVTQDQLKALFDDKKAITFGDKNSKLVFVEISDPSCPFCHVAAGKNPTVNAQMGAQFIMAAEGGSYVAPVPEMKKLVEQGKASMVWLYANGHGNGEMGTKAMYCAHEKGKFWEVHDLLMTQEGYDIVNTTVKNDKTKAGEMANFLSKAVDSNFMKSCLEQGKYDDRIAIDSATAAKFGFSGTPSFFVNTQNFPGAYSYTDLKSVVEAQL